MVERKEKSVSSVEKTFKQSLEVIGDFALALKDGLDEIRSENQDLKRRLADAEAVIVDHGVRLDNADVRAGVVPSGLKLTLTNLQDMEVTSHV